jgi:hypothetical protein
LLFLPPWIETLAAQFCQACQNGYDPAAALALDASGHLFGTTTTGGDLQGGPNGYGTVFEFQGGYAPTTVIHYFNVDPTDGHAPSASVIFDATGYSTTAAGGTFGYGTVFELSPPHAAGGVWKEKILHNFDFNGKDGISPSSSLVFDAVGNLYGTTPLGGTGSCTQGCGTAYELSPTVDGPWTERILHNFGVASQDGTSPLSNLVIDHGDLLYGTTSGGGAYGGGRCS